MGLPRTSHVPGISPMLVPSRHIPGIYQILYPYWIIPQFFWIFPQNTGFLLGCTDRRVAPGNRRTRTAARWERGRFGALKPRLGGPRTSASPSTRRRHRVELRRPSGLARPGASPAPSWLGPGSPDRCRQPRRMRRDLACHTRG
jgi:hypothetical protein